MIFTVVRSAANKFDLWAVDDVIYYQMNEVAKIKQLLLFRARFLDFNFLSCKELDQIENLFDGLDLLFVVPSSLLQIKLIKQLFS